MKKRNISVILSVFMIASTINIQNKAFALTNDNITIQNSINDAAPLGSYSNYSFLSTSGGTNLNNDLSKVTNLEEGTIVVRFNSSSTAIQSLISLSNSTKRDTHFHLYTSGTRVGVEIKNEVASGGVAINKHFYADVALNEGFNTVAFKVEKNKGYSLFINGVLAKTEATTATNFLNSIYGKDTMSLGTTLRSSGANRYPYSGDIDSVDIYSTPIADNVLISKTAETQMPDESTMLPSTAYKSEPINLYTPGDLGSKNFRIPSLYTTMAGTVLAGIDVRINHGGDSPANIDTGIRRKEAGKDWEQSKVILDYPGNASVIDSSIVQDKSTGRIFLIDTHFPDGYGYPNTKLGTGYKEINGIKYKLLFDANNNEFTIRENGVVYDSQNSITAYTVDVDQNLYENNIKVSNVLLSNSPLKVYGTAHLVIMHSDDDGKSWSKPRELTPDVKADWMKFFGAGPGRGHQITNGIYAGRLVFPIYYTNSNNFQSSAVIYSDDHGVTWKTGESPTDGRDMGSGVIGNSQTASSGNQLTESQVVEMPNGQLKLFMRNTGGTVRIATSFDGGATWDNDVAADSRLTEPYCQLSVINYTEKINGKDAIIFSNPATGGRNGGTVRIGLINQNGTYANGEPRYDIDWAYNKLVKAGTFGYSCLTQLSNGNIGLFYEGTGSLEMSYMEMNLEYLKYNIYENSSNPQILSIENIDADNKYYPGEEISLKVNFSQNVVLMGDKFIKVNVGDKEVTLSMDRYASPSQVVFKGTLPLDTQIGQYGITALANNNLRITTVFNKTINLSETITLLTIDVLEAPVLAYGNYDINSNSGGINITNDLNKISTLAEGTIIVRFDSNSTNVQSLLGVSNNEYYNRYFSLYITGTRVGYELRTQTTAGASSNGTTNIDHIYANTTLNSGYNTVALKVEKGVGAKIFLNGNLIKTVDKSDIQFINGIGELNSAMIGQTDRFTGGNEYNFLGSLGYLEVYNKPLSDKFLLNKTIEQ